MVGRDDAVSIGLAFPCLLKNDEDHEKSLFNPNDRERYRRSVVSYGRSDNGRG